MYKIGTEGVMKKIKYCLRNTVQKNSHCDYFAIRLAEL